MGTSTRFVTPVGAAIILLIHIISQQVISGHPELHSVAANQARARFSIKRDVPAETGLTVLHARDEAMLSPVSCTNLAR